MPRLAPAESEECNLAAVHGDRQGLDFAICGNFPVMSALRFDETSRNDYADAMVCGALRSVLSYFGCAPRTTRGVPVSRSNAKPTGLVDVGFGDADAKLNAFNFFPDTAKQAKDNNRSGADETFVRYFHDEQDQGYVVVCQDITPAGVKDLKCHDNEPLSGFNVSPLTQQPRNRSPSDSPTHPNTGPHDALYATTPTAPQHHPHQPQPSDGWEHHGAMPSSDENRGQAPSVYSHNPYPSSPDTTSPHHHPHHSHTSP